MLFFMFQKKLTHMQENSIQMTIRALEKMREHYSTSRGASQVASDSYNTVKDQYWDQVISPSLN